MRICTIVARNYLAYARVLAESFSAQHPDGRCSVLVIDDRGSEVDAASEPFDVIRPGDLKLDRFEGMAAMYDVTELATAVKPWLLEHLLQVGDDSPIVYFDPDIRFYASVEKIEALAAEHGIVLTPHITSPIPEDDKQPGELDLMASGTYNLGFLALAPCKRTEELLGWWQRRLRYDCVIDHALGYFVDQRWFDLVPNTFGGAAILSDPGMNVAYWNLHERTIRQDPDGSWMVNDEPLRFYHFSGFDPKQPHLLSKHQTRTRLSENQALATLCSEFAAEVDAHRRPGEQEIPYAWEKLGDGRRWDRRLRRLYREGEREGAFTLSPFERDGAEELFDWLNEPAPQASTISRFWFDVYSERPDIRHDFPDLVADLDDFERWMEGFGHEVGDVRGLLPRAVQQRKDEHAARVEVAEDAWGVNVAGFLQSELGIGEAARGLICGLDAARVPLLPVHGSWRPSSRQDHVYTMYDVESAAFPINIVCVNADVMPQWAQQAGRRFFADRYTIGLWWWEVLEFPEEWMPSFDLVDEVWVASQHVADALMPIATVPVTKVSMPVVLPAIVHRSRAELGLPEGFLFLFLFDHHSVFERKNPLAIIEAFKRAFPGGGGPSLVVKCINHEHHLDAHEQLLLAAADHPDVHILDHYVSANDKNAMIASADCYVSLHRAEGFGLTLAESMCLGKPVIATRYGGNLDFMDDANSWLVDCKMVQIGARGAPYPAHGVWAEPDAAQAARYMREIYEDPARARERAAHGIHRMREAHSPAAAGRTMRERLQHVHERRERWPRKADAGATSPRLQQLQDLLSAGDLAPIGAQNPLRQAFRRVMLRLIKPFTAYQQAVDHALLETMRELDAGARTDRLREAQRAAGALAELRRQSTIAQQLQSEVADMRSGARPAEEAKNGNGHAGREAVRQAGER